MSRLMKWTVLPYVAIAVIVALIGIGGGRRGEAVAQAAFTPTPCPTGIEWRFADPGFEALPGATVHFGRYEGGLYRIEVPDDWNGELVLNAHGFTTTAGEMGDLLRVGTPSMALRAYLIEEGFAWAASSYRCNGYVPGIGLQDTMLLSDLFVEMNGGRAPTRTYLIGGSMGGHTTILGLHQYPRAFAGGLALCPAGPELFDFFLGVGAAAEVVTGLQFEPGTSARTLARMNELLGTPENYTEMGRQLASIQIHISGGPRPFALEGLASRFAANISGGGLAGDTSPLSLAATNVHIDYAIDPGLGLTAVEINAAVRRKPAYPYFRGSLSPYPELQPFSGEIERPLLTTHTTGDLFVPIFLQQVLKRAFDLAGTGDLLVQRIIRSPGHCTFSVEETVQAFADLVTWVREGRRPAGDEDEILGDLGDAGRRFTTPMRPGDPGGVRVLPGTP